MEQLPSDEVHIHVLRTDQAPLSGPVEQFLPLLPREERGRYFEFEREGRRREFLWSRLLVRRVLAAVLGREAGNLNFRTGDHGKPFLEDSDAYFNISHTDGLVACSMSRRKVGIDVEKMADGEKDIKRWELIAGHFFTDDEKKHFYSGQEEDRKRFFYQLFTLKEAALKAIGNGLSHFRDISSPPFPLQERFNLHGWEFFTRILEPGGFCLSHAAECGGQPLQYRLFDWTEATFGNRFAPHPPVLFCMEGTHGHLHR